jgi:chromosome segregation ATPase
MALTTEQIHQTAQELTEKGINPTLANVRSALGGGSFTTIGEALKTWKQAQKDNEKIKQVDIAPQIKDRADVLIGELWQNALDLADERLKLEREALAVAQQQADAKVAEMAEALAQVEAEQIQLNAQLDELTQSNDTYKHLTNDWSQKYAQLESKYQILETTHTEQGKQLTANNAQLEELKQQYSQAQKDNAVLTGELATSKATASHQLSEIERLKADLSKTTTKSEKSLETAQNEQNRLKNELTKATETATAQNKAQSDEISQLKADKAGLVATNQALQAQLDSLQARFDKFLSNAD